MLRAAKDEVERKIPNEIRAESAPDAEVLILKLYVAGQTTKSLQAFANLKRICEDHAPGKYYIEVIDLINNPQLAKGDQILTIPTLVRKLPEPVRKIIGIVEHGTRAGRSRPAVAVRTGALMKGSKPVSETWAFEEALGEWSRDHYVLRLFVAGTTPKSARAIENIRAICEDILKGKCDLEVIDIYQHPERAKPEQIVVAPTLVKRFPLPVCRMIGDLSNKDRVLAGLNLVRHQAGQ